MYPAIHYFRHILSHYVIAVMAPTTKHTKPALNIVVPDLVRAPSSAMTLLAITTGDPAADMLDTSGAIQVPTWGIV